MTPDLAPLGFYGKLPARGDFIMRRLGRAFIDAWDDWLQRAFLASRETLGEQWLDTYLTSPIWRFALSAGSCGPNTVLGIMIPSVDKVGRYFPLMLGREIEPGLELGSLMTSAAAWYQTVEDLALAALAPEFRLETLEHPVALDADIPAAAKAASAPLAPPGLYVPFDELFNAAELWRAHGPTAQRRTLWWTSGSARVSPCLLLCPGLPAGAAFTALLDGGWQRDGWVGAPEPAASSVPADAVAEPSAADPAPSPSAAAMALEPIPADAAAENASDVAEESGAVDFLAELMGSKPADEATAAEAASENAAAEPETIDPAATAPASSVAEVAVDSGSVDVLAELIGSDRAIEPSAGEGAQQQPDAADNKPDNKSEAMERDAAIEPAVDAAAAEPGDVDVLALLSGGVAVAPKADGA